MRLSRYFTLEEMTITSYKKYKLMNRDGAEHFFVKSNLKALCLYAMDYIRKEWGIVYNHSGYRCLPLNKTVGSSPRSQHVLGQACDFHVKGRTSGKRLYEVFDWIRFKSGIKYHQLIWEHGWIHISMPTGYRDQQVISIIKGKRVIWYKGD